MRVSQEVDVNERLIKRCPACNSSLGDETVQHFGYPLCACGACGLWFWNERVPPNYDTIYETAEYEAAQRPYEKGRRERAQSQYE